MLKRYLLPLILLLANFNISSSYATPDVLLESIFHQAYDDFENDPNIPQEEKDTVRPYLLPENHPIKSMLDAIFINKRPLHDAQTFKNAGFITWFIQPRSFIRVASHDLVPGYLFKIHLDSELRLKEGTPGWKWFSNRVHNARVIAKYIKSKKCKYFTVPKKWIYPTPALDRSQISDDGKSLIKNVVLVVEDMQLVSKEDNKYAWKTIIKEEHLDEFLAIIKYAGGSSYRASNVAFTKNGKFAFIDTEYTTKQPNYAAILPYLSPEMAVYWKKIAKLN